MLQFFYMRRYKKKGFRQLIYTSGPDVVEAGRNPKGSVIVPEHPPQAAQAGLEAVALCSERPR